VHSTRRELLYLTDIVEAAEAIASFIQDQDRDSFVGNDLVRSAILQKLQIIGEAAAHVGDETRAKAEDVPWHEVVGFRNFTIHAYFAVDWDIVWATAVDDAPAIADAVRELLSSLPGTDDSD
jgi:uncharacterized protein with HEPN domain